MEQCFLIPNSVQIGYGIVIIEYNVFIRKYFKNAFVYSKKKGEFREYGVPNFN